MKISDVRIGEIYTYYPKTNEFGDNSHYPVLVEEVTKSGRVKCKDSNANRTIVTHPKRLSDQMDLF